MDSEIDRFTPFAHPVRTPAATPPGTSSDLQHDPADLNPVRARSEALLRAADEAEAHSLSERTRVLYAQDWERFVAWCDRVEVQPVPATAETLRMYVMDMAMTVTSDGRQAFKVSTIERHLASIGYFHRVEGHPSPAADPRVARVLKGLRSERQQRPRRMRPLLRDDVEAVLSRMNFTAWPDGLAAVRDAFVLLAGFAGAFRRSELAGLCHEDLTWSAYDGIHVFLGRSKGDQEGEGVTIPLPYGEHPSTCVVCAYVRWVYLVVAADVGRPTAMRRVLDMPAWGEWEHVCREGVPQIDPRMPLVRAVIRGGRLGAGGVSGDALHAMVKRRAAVAGFHSQVGFHSLRAGFVTQARRNGADTRSIRRQTRHRSDAMVEVYDREYVPLQDNAVTKLGM